MQDKQKDTLREQRRDETDRASERKHADIQRYIHTHTGVKLSNAAAAAAGEVYNLKAMCLYSFLRAGVV